MAHAGSQALPATCWEGCCLLGPGSSTDDRVPVPGIFPAAVFLSQMDADKASAQTATCAEDLRLRYCTEGLGFHRFGSANSLHKEQAGKAFTHMLGYESGKIWDKESYFCALP